MIELNKCPALEMWTVKATPRRSLHDILHPLFGWIRRCAHCTRHLFEKPIRPGRTGMRTVLIYPESEQTT